MLPGLVDVPVVVLAWGGPARPPRVASGSARRSGPGSDDRPRARLGPGCLGALDRVAGAIVGAAQAVLILWLAGGILATGAVPGLGQVAQTSRAIRAIAVVLPPPTAIVLRARPGPRRIGPAGCLPRARPPAGIRRSICRTTRSPSCSAVGPPAPWSESRPRPAPRGPPAPASSWRAGYVVTNAHVIAGAADDHGGQRDRPAAGRGRSSSTRSSTSPCSGDRARTPRHSSSPRASRRAATLGATFGYPGGGGAVVEPAAVTYTLRRRGPGRGRCPAGDAADRRAPGGDRAGRQRRSAAPRRRDGRRRSCSRSPARTSGRVCALPDGRRDRVTPAVGRTRRSIPARASTEPYDPPMTDRPRRDTLPSVELRTIADAFWDGFLAAHPTFATVMGDRRFDDRLDDLSPAARDAEIERLGRRSRRHGARPGRSRRS